MNFGYIKGQPFDKTLTPSLSSTATSIMVQDDDKYTDPGMISIE